MKFAKIVDNAILPTRKHPTDAGLDLYSCERVVIPQFSSVVVNTGITVEVPKGFFLWITNKSKSDYLIGAGIVDQDYQGELKVRIVNYRDVPLIITPGDAIAQIIMLPLLLPHVEEVDIAEVHAEKTERGNTGGIVEAQKVKMMMPTGEIKFIDSSELESL